MYIDMTQANVYFIMVQFLFVLDLLLWIMVPLHIQAKRSRW